MPRICYTVAWWTGRRFRQGTVVRRRHGGSAASLLSLLAYLGIIALLSDARLYGLLLAFASAVLLVSLRALVRCCFLIREYKEEISSGSGG